MVLTPCVRGGCAKHRSTKPNRSNLIQKAGAVTGAAVHCTHMLEHFTPMLEKSTGSCLHIAAHEKRHANNQHRLIHLRKPPAPPQFSDPEVSRGSALGYRGTRCQGYAISIFKTTNSQRNKKGTQVWSKYTLYKKIASNQLILPSIASISELSINKKRFC